MGIDLAQHGLDILEVEQRRDAFVAGRRSRLARSASRIAQVGRVAQQDGQQVGAGRVRVDRPAVAALHQQRQPPAMIDVGMAQHHGVDVGGLERERQAVARRRVGTALDHAAVQQQLAAARTHDVAGTGHFARGAEKLQLHAGHTLTSHIPAKERDHERPVPAHIDRRSFLIGGAVIGAGLYVGIRFAENRFEAAAGSRSHFQAQRLRARRARRHASP